MSSLNVARLSNILKDLFVLRGGPPAAPEVSDDVQPVVVIEGERPEHGFLGGEHHWSSHLFVGVTAGEFSAVAIGNPADSGAIVVVQSVWPNTSVQNIGIQAMPVPGTDTDVPLDFTNRRDTRLGVTHRFTAHRITASNIAKLFDETVNGGFLFHGANFNVNPIIEVVLSPGWALVVESVVVATQVRASMWGYERFLERSERSA